MSRGEIDKKTARITNEITKIGKDARRAELEAEAERVRQQLAEIG